MAGRRVLDVYDEEFVTNMEIAKNLMALVQNPRGEVKSNHNSSQSYIVSVEQLGNDNAELSVRVAPYNDKNHKFTRIVTTMRKILAYVQTNLYTLSSDKEICKKWILKLRQLKATDVTVKKNRNSFFKYFLQVLHRAVQGEDVLGASPLDAKVN
jgi:hypothetical protein